MVKRSEDNKLSFAINAKLLAIKDFFTSFKKLRLKQLQISSYQKTEQRKVYKRNIIKKNSVKPLSKACKNELLETIWGDLMNQYFPGNTELTKYQICWSRRRQKRTLGSCNINDKKVVIAKELNYAEYFPLLSPLIYHEMCHAVLGHDIKRESGKRAWHGKEFKNLEKKHPQTEVLNAWVKKGGWSSAVRSARMKEYHQKKNKN